MTSSGALPTVVRVRYRGVWLAIFSLTSLAACHGGGEPLGGGSQGGAGPGGFGGASGDATDELGSDPEIMDPEIMAVVGSYCSLRVNRPENCTGQDAHYFSFEADLSDDSSVALRGQYCRGYGIDCAPLTATYEAGELSYTYMSELGSFSADLSYDEELENLTGLGYSVHCDCYVDFYLFSVGD